MPKVKVIPVGRKPIYIQLEASISVEELTKLVLKACEVKEGHIIFKGVALNPTQSSTEIINFKHNDILLLSPVRQNRIEQTGSKEEMEEDPDADVTYHIDESTHPIIRFLYHFLSNKLHIPKIVLYWLFSIRPINYVLFIVWMILSPVAAHYDLGPIYILGTIFVLIVTNLGIRRQGEDSAYSLFNDGVRQLPGQLDATQVDQQIRQGRM